ADGETAVAGVLVGDGDRGGPSAAHCCSNPGDRSGRESTYRKALLPSRDRPSGPRSHRGPGGRFDLVEMVEAVGIEPTSGNPRQQASTSLAGYLVRLASRPPNRPGHRSASS